jgi:uncharacterized protein
MDLQVTDNADEQRYEAASDGTVAGFAEYKLARDLIVFTHTEVDQAFEGQGVGGELVRQALDDVRGRDLKVLPLCPFVKAWIGRHPEYHDVVYGAPASRVSD